MKAAYFVLLIFLVNFVYASCSADQININTASLSELDKLDSIGPVKAQAIIDTRPFSSVDDLNKVQGIGDVTLQKIKSQGLACVSGSDLSVDNNLKQDENLNTIEEENVENEEDVDIFSEPNIITAEVIEETPISVEYQSESIINLNSDSDITKEEIIYESKNEIIRKYAIYAFAIFLVLVIIILFFKR